MSLEPRLGSWFTLCSDLLVPELEELEEAAKDHELEGTEEEDLVEDILLNKVSKVGFGGGLHFAARAVKIDILKL